MADQPEAGLPLLIPLYPADTDQGDPFVFVAPVNSDCRFQFYVYTTGEEPTEGSAFPVYASNDLATWQRLANALRVEQPSAHWAPCVRYVPGLEFPCVMLYSRALGLGEEAHIGHKIRRAHAKQPEGPFVDTGHVLTEDLDFAIDPEVYRLANGRLKIAFAMDFVDVEPYGTGIVEADINEELTVILSSPKVLTRPKYDWQIYDPERVMPWKAIPGVDWTTQTVRWSTIEAPVGGLTSPAGRAVYLYSAGCFFDFYAVGALIEDDNGDLVDVSNSAADFVIQPDPENGFYGPGHCSWLHAGKGEDFLMLHARFGSPDSTRQMCLSRLQWTEADRPIAGL